VLARVPRCIQQSFRGRKKEPTQNVMVVVGFDIKFSYVLAGWEGLHMMQLFWQMPLRGKMGSQSHKVIALINY
jgi:hypothetical protein